MSYRHARARQWELKASWGLLFGSNIHRQLMRHEKTLLLTGWFLSDHKWVVTSLMSLLIGHGPERLNISKSCLHGGCSKEYGPGLREAAQKEIQNWSREAEDSPRVTEKGNTHSWGKSSSKSESPPVPGWLSYLQRLLQACIPQALLQDRSGIYVV